MAGFSLAALLGQAGASLVETPEQAAERQRLEDLAAAEDTITVMAPQPNVVEPDTPALQSNQQAQLNAYDAISNPPEHRGAFGLRGLLREIIGRAGDVASVAQGGDANYETTRRRERLSDAMLGFTGGDEAARAAAERMVAAGDPTAGRAMFEQTQTDALRRSQLEAQRANNQATQQDRASRRSARYLQTARRVLAAPEAFVNGIINPRAYALLQAIGQQEGIAPEDIGVTSSMIPDDAQLLAASDISLYQQESLKDRDEALEYQGRNTAANEQRAARAPQPRAPRSETADERYIRLGNMRLSDMSPGEQQWFRQETARREGQTTRGSPRGSDRLSNSVTTRSGRTFTPSN